MPDYNNHADVQILFTKAHEAEYDNRLRAKEANDFVEKDDGQWEPDIVSNMKGRPRYTFDKCNPVVDSIAGELEQASFSIKVRPSGGDASKDTALLFDGIIRNIEANSNAEKKVYQPAARKMVKCGFDAWQVKQDWVDDDSFNQDLIIKKIPNAIDRVFLDENAQEQDGSDANHGFILHAMTEDRYRERWPEGACQAVEDPESKQVYYFKPNFIILGQIFYKKQEKRELVLMSNGSVYVVDEKFKAVTDELREKGIVEKRRRTKMVDVVYSRFYDGADWLEGEKRTVFSYIPIIPIYGNFDIDEDKIIYRGAVQKLMDPQRVYNYAQSRQIEEGALAPREKHWMTAEQAKGYEDKIQTMNTNADPVQLYNHIPDQQPPYKTGGPQVNMGLAQTAESMKMDITESSGIFAANQGNAPDQSGYAIELQIGKGDNSTIKYFTSQEIAICHTARILIDAIPKVYDTERTVRILGEDGSVKMEEINHAIFDDEQQKFVVLNDLSRGSYDVVCDVGPAFKSRQQETNKAFLDMVGVDPTILETGKDIWLNNMNTPGMDVLAARVRKQLFEAGMIPDDQMTDEEKQRAQEMIAAAQAEGQQPDPMQEALEAQTQMQAAETESRIDERLQKIALQQRKQNLDEAKFEQSSQLENMQFMLDKTMAAVDELAKQAQTLKTLREAMGVDVAVGPGTTGAFKKQAGIVEDEQRQQ